MEGAALTAEQRIALAEYLTGRRFENAGLPEEAFCASPGPTLDAARISWTGFAGNLQGTGYQGAEKAGLTADEIPGLELRWGFAFPGATQSRGSPTVVGEAGQFGEVLASRYPDGLRSLGLRRRCAGAGRDRRGGPPRDRRHRLVRRQPFQRLRPRRRKRRTDLEGQGRLARGLQRQRERRSPCRAALRARHGGRRSAHARPNCPAFRRRELPATRLHSGAGCGPTGAGLRARDPDGGNRQRHRRPYGGFSRGSSSLAGHS